MGACCESSDDLRPATAQPGEVARPGKNDEKITITYFEGGHGRPDPIQQLLEHKGVPYERRNISQEAWGEKKARGDTGEMGQLPVVVTKGREMQQTVATLRALGVEYGYYNPRDWKAAMAIDMISETENEMFSKFAGIAFFAKEEEKEGAFNEFKEGGLRKFLNVVEAQLAKNSTNKFLVGEGMTIADFSMASFLFNCVANENNPYSAQFTDYLLEFPMLGAYSKRLHAEVKNYLDTRAKLPF